MNRVIILEEAHIVVGNTGEAQPSPDIADPKPFSAEYVCRMLGEVRALGLGMIIVNQLPLGVAPEVTKSTLTKLVFSELEKDEREFIGDSMLLNPTEIEELARLKVGEAFFYTEGYHKPCRIRTLNLYGQFDFHSVKHNEDILAHLRGDAWFQKASGERTMSELIELRERMDRFDDMRLQLIRELTSLMARHPRILARRTSRARSRGLAELRDNAFQLKRRLSDVYHSYLRNSYRRYLAPETGSEVQDALIQEMRKNLIGRFESIVKPDVKKCLDTIDAFIKRCQAAEK